MKEILFKICTVLVVTLFAISEGVLATRGKKEDDHKTIRNYKEGKR